MSLLMDALKKAEQAKQEARNAEAAAVPPPLTSAPSSETQAPAEAPPPLPELPPKLELLDDEFIAHAQERPAGQGAGRGRPRPSTQAPAQPSAKPATATATAPAEAAQAAARNVFAAKQPAARSKTFALVVVGLTTVAVAGIGVYFWLQLQPAGGLTALAPPPAPAPRLPPSAAEPAPPLAAAPTPLPRADEPVTPREEPPPARPATAAPPAAAETPIRITASRLKINPALMQAFDAFNAGDLAAAKAAYARVLKAEPKNLDALHGAAAVALREGRPDLAETYYQSALEADPKDAVAHAGLVGLRAPADAATGESRLKTLLAAQPDLPELNFALGNVYAREGRWHEAQQAYFKAYSGEPGNPDYLFNLAVSLDQLHQSKLAVQYYAQALAAAASRPAGFDKAQVTARLRELQQQP